MPMSASLVIKIPATKSFALTAAVLGSAKLGEVARSFEVWRFSSHPQQFQDQKTSVKRHQMLHTYNFFIAVAALEAQL